MKMKTMIQNAADYLYEYYYECGCSDDGEETPSEWVAFAFGCEVKDLKRCGINTDSYDELYTRY